MPTKAATASLNNSQVKTVLLEKLGAYQNKAGGLYVVSNNLLHVGSHSVELMPVVESEGSKQGKSIVAMRIEVIIDGVQISDAVFGAIGIATNRDEAVTVGLGEWYLGFAVPFFQALGGKPPLLTVADYEVFAGALGLRGGAATGWVDGSEAMNRKILDAVLPEATSSTSLEFFDLKVMVPPFGQPQSECRINGVVSPKIAVRLIALDWPRTTDGYMFKQAFVLKKRQSAPSEK